MFHKFLKPKIMQRDNDGKLIDKGFPKHFNKGYSEALIHYMNCIEPLFDKAQKKSEFEFILTLLRFRGIQPSEHNPYENSIKTIDALMDIEKKMKGHERINIFLWVYGHIVEASEPYETIANLLNIMEGKGFAAWNFPKKKIGKDFYINQSPSEKIRYLETEAKKVGMSEVVNPIKDVLDRDLRNAVFHSDYGVNYGEVILPDPPRIYSRSEVLLLINKALAYHETIKNLINGYIEGYNKSKIIPVSPGFSRNPNEKAVLIVRKNHGLIGMKNIWSKEEIAKGEIDWIVINMLGYERKYLDRGIVEMPPNRVQYANRILSIIPRRFKSKLIPIVERLLFHYG